MYNKNKPNNDYDDIVDDGFIVLTLITLGLIVFISFIVFIIFM